MKEEIYPIKKILLPQLNEKTKFICFLIEDNISSRKMALALFAILKDILKEEISFETDISKIKETNNNTVIFLIGREKEIPQFFHKTNAKLIFIPLVTNSNKFNDLKLLKKFNASKKKKIVNNNFFSINKNRDNLYLRFNPLAIYFNEIFGHLYGRTNPNTIYTILYFFRTIFVHFLNTKELKDNKRLPISLFTIDSEDQHNYFDNLNNKCTDITGSFSNLHDTRLDIAIKTSLNRFKDYGIKPTFMITGSDIRKDSSDGFGNKLSEPEKNIEILTKIAKQKNVSIGTHGNDHQDWLHYGYSFDKSMNLKKKFLYFFNSGGNLKTLYKYLIACTKLKFKNKEGILGIKGKFTKEKLIYQITKLEQLLKKNNIKFIKFHRSPGFRRSAMVINYLDKYEYFDSSDLLRLEKHPLPPTPYSLFKWENGNVSLSKVKELPCVFIDEYLRTSNSKKLHLFLHFLEDVFKYPETVLTIISHTKVTGGDYNHCHIYPRNPISGLSQPPKEHNIRQIYGKIALKSRSLTVSQFLDTLK